MAAGPFCVFQSVAARASGRPLSAQKCAALPEWRRPSRWSTGFWSRRPRYRPCEGPSPARPEIALSSRSARFAEIERIAQRHCERRRSSRSDWRCHLPAISGRRAMHRLVESLAGSTPASFAPSDADGSMPREPVSMAATSDRMSPNRLSVTITSNCFGRRTSCMPSESASMMLELYIGVLPRVQAGDHFVPEHAGLHHIALFRGRDLVAALARELEGDPSDPLDLIGVIDLGVDAALLPIAEIDDLLRLAEIDPAGQFAHDHEIEPVDKLALQRGGVGERRIADRRPQIGEERHILPQAQKARLRDAARKERRPISGRRRRRGERRQPPEPEPCRPR